MLIIAIERAVGLIVLLYLLTGCCCCLCLPLKDNEAIGMRVRTDSQRRIQICGAKLTSIITSMCDGYVHTPSEGPGGESNRTHSIWRRGVVEECCKNPCDLNFLLQHCGEKSKLKTMYQSKREGSEPTNELPDHIANVKTESSTRETPSDGVPAAAAAPRRAINATEQREDVPRIQVGTIKPEVYGGAPLVVAPRHKSSRTRLRLDNYVPPARSRQRSLSPRH